MSVRSQVSSAVVSTPTGWPPTIQKDPGVYPAEFAGRDESQESVVPKIDIANPSVYG